MAEASFVAGDTGSRLRVTCTDDSNNAAIDLTGATVTLRWLNRAGETIERTMIQVTPAGGVAEYQFAANELEAGVMQFDVQIMDAGGRRTTNLSRIFETVRPPVS